MRLIFDADPVVYGAGFAAERHVWDVVAEDAEGNLHEAFFEPHPDKGGAKEQANKWLADNRLTALSLERRVIPEPCAFALQAVSTTLKGAMRSVAERFNIPVEDLQMTVLLSGPGNWREDLAKIAPYKGNRDAAHKPYHYQAIRDYLVHRWGATVVHGREADDEVSIIAHQHIAEGDLDGYVICTIDKDLDQVPGHHYDYKKHVHYEVPEEHAERWFWVQCLAGDATDNIPGCYKMGVKTAETLVDQFQAGCRDRKCLWQCVVERYRASELRYGDKCPWVSLGITAEQAALETARLVYMQQRPGHIWDPPS